jgi:hypothetical protein
MEREVSCSQQTGIDPYSEPYESKSELFNPISLDTF